MKVTTFEEAQELPHDATVYAFKGTVKSMTKYYPADKAKPDSTSFQVMTLTVNGKEMKAVLKNRDAIPDIWRGKPIYILAHQGDKGWTGVKVKDEQRKGSDGTERVLWVTRTAEMVPAKDYEAGNGGPATESAPASQQKTAPQARRGAKSNQHYDEESGDKEAGRMLWKSRNLMRKCLRMAMIIKHEFEMDFRAAGVLMSDSQFQGVTSTLFIQNKEALMMLAGKPMEFPEIDPAKYGLKVTTEPLPEHGMRGTTTAPAEPEAEYVGQEPGSEETAPDAAPRDTSDVPF